MKISVHKFCTLATSPSWQAWLHHHDAELCKRFIKRLQTAHNCGQNREIMVDTLAEIDKNGGGDKLLGFIQQHYPYMLIDEAPAQSQSVSSDDVFGYFNPNILTYPRRIIFTGPENELRRKIQEFTIDKIKSDSVIVNGVAYIEYLTQDDSSVKDSVPQKSWLIARWKLRHQSLT